MRKMIAHWFRAFCVGLTVGVIPYIFSYCYKRVGKEKLAEAERLVEQAQSANTSFADRPEILRRAMWYLGEHVSWDSEMSQSRGRRTAARVLEQMVRCKREVPGLRFRMADFSSCLDFCSVKMGSEVFESFIREGLVDWTDAGNDTMRELPLSGFVSRLALHPQGRDAEAIKRMIRRAIADGASAESFYAGMKDRGHLWETTLQTGDTEFIAMIRGILPE